MCNIFITLGVGLVLLALPVACSTKERAPCRKVTAWSTNKETKQDIPSRFSSLGSDFFFYSQYISYFLDATDRADLFSTANANMYPSDFHFCLVTIHIVTSLQPFYMDVPVSHNLSVISSYIPFFFFCDSLCASPFVSPLTASFCLMPTSDFLIFVDLFSFFSCLRSYVYSPPSLFSLHDGDGWGLWMSGL